MNYDYFLTRDLFWTPIFAEYYRDPFQNVDRRLKIGIAIGYSIIDTRETDWIISTGPAYQETRYESVQKGSSAKDSAFILAIKTNFETELNSKVDLEGLHNVALGDEETGNYSHHSILTVETELTDKPDFDVSTVWDRVREPVPDENNITPQQDDFRILIGLGYDL